MKTFLAAVATICLLCTFIGGAASQPQPAVKSSAALDSWSRMKATIEGYLGKPYVWGSSGLKSFDCSGFVWRVMCENGFLLKRTTARKLYISLPKAQEGADLTPGNIVFFDDLRHCGIVNNRDTFYHAMSVKGTTLSPFAPYWGARISGFRRPAGAK